VSEPGSKLESVRWRGERDRIEQSIESKKEGARVRVRVTVRGRKDEESEGGRRDAGGGGPTFTWVVCLSCISPNQNHLEKP